VAVPGGPGAPWAASLVERTNTRSLRRSGRKMPQNDRPPLRRVDVSSLRCSGRLPSSEPWRAEARIQCDFDSRHSLAQFVDWLGACGEHLRRIDRSGQARGRGGARQLRGQGWRAILHENGFARRCPCPPGGQWGQPCGGNSDRRNNPAERLADPCARRRAMRFSMRDGLAGRHAADHGSRRANRAAFGLQRQIGAGAPASPMPCSAPTSIASGCPIPPSSTSLKVYRSPSPG